MHTHKSLSWAHNQISPANLFAASEFVSDVGQTGDIVSHRPVGQTRDIVSHRPDMNFPVIIHRAFNPKKAANSSLQLMRSVDTPHISPHASPDVPSSLIYPNARLVASVQIVSCGLPCEVGFSLSVTFLIHHLKPLMDRFVSDIFASKFPRFLLSASES